MDDNGNHRPPPLRSLSGVSPYEGIPVRGRPFDVKSDDPEHLQPKVRHEAHVKVFDLTKPEDVEEYRRIAQAATENKVVVGIEEIQYCEDIGNWRVLVRWYDQFLTAPEENTGDKKSWS